MLADRYELDHKIGRGGTGTVWLGHDTVLNRDVALKRIGIGHGGGEPNAERAEREAHLAAQVNHRNVVVVFDVVDDGGNQWLVMENVDGPTLAGLIAQHGRLDRLELAPLVGQIAGALGAAHDCGIVHRDVQPSNILLTHDGVAKLSDFGVAREQADAYLTQADVLTGSPAYLPPEVATGHTATAASDVWSLGATVFHALSGHAPYALDDTVLAARRRTLHNAMPGLDVRGPLPMLVAEMMQHDPHDRPTMAEVEEAVAATRSPVFVDGDGDDTQGFAAFSAAAAPPPARPVEKLVVSPPPPPPGPPVAAPAAAGGDAAMARSPWLVAAGVATLIAITASVFVRADDRPAGGTLVAEAVGPARPAAGSATSSSSASPKAATPTETTPAPYATPEQTAHAMATERMEGFTIDYLSTASNDPDTGFTMLTPAFQRASNGLAGYKGFWGGVEHVNLQRVSVDPSALRVSYTYSYDFNGDRRSDSVTLQLVQSPTGYLIAGER